VSTIWRLCSARWAKTAFSGAGAAANPGRWNSMGTRMVYCSETRALCALEILAQVEDKRNLARARYVVIPVEVPEKLIAKPARFPSDWRAVPPPLSTRHWGDRFVTERRFPVMRVPSAVVSGEFNYLLNPLHPDFSNLQIGKPTSFSFDARIA
jgi:RES domain-containing protein